MYQRLLAKVAKIDIFLELETGLCCKTIHFKLKALLNQTFVIAYRTGNGIADGR